MARLTELSFDSAVQLCRAFGVELARLEPLEAGSVNSNFRLTDRSGRRFFARIYEEQGLDGAQAELDLIDELGEAGVPVARPLRAEDQRRALVVSEKAFAVFPWLDGDILCQARVTAEDCREVGRALAAVHRVSPRLASLGPGRFGPSDLERRLDYIERQGPSAVSSDVGKIRSKLARYLADRDHELPLGLVHGDLFRDNVLWQKGRIVALLDFESACKGPFVYDLMVTVHAWCFADAFVPELVRALFSGYESVRSLESREKSTLGVEASLAALRFAITRITDFSMRAPPGEPPQRDYRRFLARLEAVESGVLEACLHVSS